MPCCVARRTSPRIDRAAGEVEAHRLAVAEHARQRAVVEHARGPCSGTSATRRAGRWARPTATRTTGCAAPRAAPARGRRSARAPCATAATRSRSAPRRTAIGPSSCRRSGAAASARSDSTRIPRRLPRRLPRSARTVPDTGRGAAGTAGRRWRARCGRASHRTPGDAFMNTLSATAPASAAAATTQPDFAAVKTRQQAAWSSGDYAVVGTTLQIVGESLCEALDLRSGQSVLDVAAGNGNVSLAAARRWCEVTSTDYVPAHCSRAAANAPPPSGWTSSFAKPTSRRCRSPTRSFDAVVSTFGCMFAPNPPRTASEMLRVCKPGGKIGMANWTPEGFIGQLFKTIGQHVTPPAGVESPALWGSRAAHRRAVRRAGGGDRRRRRGSSSSATARPSTWSRSSRRFYGPVLKAFAALDAAAQPDAGRRPAGADRPLQPRARRHDGRAERLPRNRDHPQGIKEPP